jgi:16S rRNA (guanine(966)-N(2))-methyltransferase RsmD
VREALFMALEPLAGLRVVDLFAGSGGLGIEALSRGAVRADFVDRDPAALAALRDNLRALELEAESRVWRMDLPRGIARLEGPLREADLVVADPPYGGETARQTIEALGVEGRMKTGARLVIEHHARDEVPESSGALSRERERRYGQTSVTTYRAAGPSI